MPTITRVPKHVELAAISAAHQLLSSGWTEDEVIEILEAGADTMIDWRQVAGPGVGDFLEIWDGPAIGAILRLVASIVSPDPIRRAERLRKRASRKEQRGKYDKAAELRARADALASGE